MYNHHHHHQHYLLHRKKLNHKCVSQVTRSLNLKWWICDYEGALFLRTPLHLFLPPSWLQFFRVKRSVTYMLVARVTPFYAQWWVFPLCCSLFVTKLCRSSGLGFTTEESWIIKKICAKNRSTSLQLVRGFMVCLVSFWHMTCVDTETALTSSGVRNSLSWSQSMSDYSPGTQDQITPNATSPCCNHLMKTV